MVGPLQLLGLIMVLLGLGILLFLGIDSLIKNIRRFKEIRNSEQHNNNVITDYYIYNISEFNCCFSASGGLVFIIAWVMIIFLVVLPSQLNNTIKLIISLLPLLILSLIVIIIVIVLVLRRFILVFKKSIQEFQKQQHDLEKYASAEDNPDNK